MNYWVAPNLSPINHLIFELSWLKESQRKRRKSLWLQQKVRNQILLTLNSFKIFLFDLRLFNQQESLDAVADASVKALEAAEEASAQAAQAAMRMTEEVKKELVDKILLPLVNAAVEFLDVLDNLLKEIFKAFTTAIYEMFFLEDLDNLAKDIIVGGKANMIDFPVMISCKLENTWEKIRGSLDDLDDVLIDTIKFGLDKIGSLSYIQNAFGGGSENKNNLSAVNRALSSSESGLEALATKVSKIRSQDYLKLYLINKKLQKSWAM